MPSKRLLFACLVISALTLSARAEEPLLQPSTKVKTPHLPQTRKPSTVTPPATAQVDRSESMEWLERSLTATDFRPGEKVSPHNPRCHLKRVGLQVYTRRDQDRFSGYSLGQSTSAIGFFEIHERPLPNAPALTAAEKSSCLREWAYVQWMRGCVKNQSYGPNQLEQLPDGTLSFEYQADVPSVLAESSVSSYRREGKQVPFYFLDWIVDSVDVDPMYWSNPEEGDRHAYYRYVPGRRIGQSDRPAVMAADLGFTNQSDGYLRLRDQRRLSNQIYVRDIPSAFSILPRDRMHDERGARLSPGRAYVQFATQVALDFKLCLHSTADVPKTALPTRFDAQANSPGAALMCWDWSSIAVFDFQSQSIKTPEVVSYCRDGQL